MSKPRRMKANLAWAKDNPCSLHAVEHDETWGCAGGIPCEPVDTELELYICENAWKCTHAYCIAHSPHATMRDCVQHTHTCYSAMVPCSCIPLSAYRAAEAEREREKAAKEAAKPEMTPECGDEVVGRNGHPPYSGRVLSISNGDAFISNEESLQLISRISYLRAVSRPALVTGEVVENRKHPEWGNGIVVDAIHYPKQKTVLFIRLHGIGYSTLVSDTDLRRVCWQPELHEVEK